MMRYTKIATCAIFILLFMSATAYSVFISLWRTPVTVTIGFLPSEDEPPRCVIKLQRDGEEISEVAVGKFFDIYVGDSTDDFGIKAVRFSSDDILDERPTGRWTDWFYWESSSGDWDSTAKIMHWAFATYGSKEVWAEVIDTSGMVSSSFATIFAVLPLPIWKEAYAPNPWGYSFKNNEVVDKNIPILPGDESLTEQSKWNIFISTFDLSNVDEKTAEEFFKELDKRKYFVGAYCFGMSASSLMEFVYPLYDQFLENQGKNTIFELEQPPIVFLDLYQRWNGGGEKGPHPVLEHIIRFHLMQIGNIAIESKIDVEPFALLNKLKEDLPKGIMYVLGIGYLVEEDKVIGHAVVPYRVDGQDIYVYDPNWPNNDNKKIEIYEESGVWKWRYKMGIFSSWPPKNAKTTFLQLFPIKALYNSGLKPQLPAATGYGTLFYLDGNADLLLVDSEGKRVGLSNGLFMQEITNIKPIITFGALPDDEARPWKQTYYGSQDNELTVVINGRIANGTYALTKFGPDYFATVSSISISDGAIDNITITSNTIRIHISQNQEPKMYNLTFNKNNNGASQTFTAINIPITPGATHQYIFDWIALSEGKKGAAVRVDSDSDGVFERVFTSDDQLTKKEFLFPEETVFTFNAFWDGVNYPVEVLLATLQ